MNLDTKEGMHEAVKWQTDFCALLGEGGKWAVPRSMSIYTIYNSKKVAVRTKGEMAIDLVFKAMGWEVREEL